MGDLLGKLDCEWPALGWVPGVKLREPLPPQFGTKFCHWYENVHEFGEITFLLFQLPRKCDQVIAPSGVVGVRGDA